MVTFAKVRSRARRMRAAPEGRPIGEFEARQRRISIPAMRELEQWDPFMRALLTFYGSKAIRATRPCNPEDLPRQLGRVSEFEEYWASFRRLSGS